MKSQSLSFSTLLCGLLLLSLLSLTTSAQRPRANGFTIQIASVATEAEAKILADELRSKGVAAYWTKADIPGKGTRYRIRMGRFKTLAAAQAAAETARAQGRMAEFIVTSYDPPVAEAASPSLKPKLTPPPPEVTARAETLIKPQAGAALGVAAHAPAIATKTEDGSAAVAENPVTSPSSERGKSPAAAPMLEAAASPKDEMIATPGVADAITDIAISNDKWKVVRRSAETDKNLHAIFFVDAMTGWAAGDAGAIHKTTDGGRSWKPLLAGVALNVNFIFFVDWNHGWMLGESGKGDAEDETILLATINGGRTWSRQPLPSVLGLYFIDALNGWAVGRNALLMKTTDGGATWHKLDAMEKLVGLPVESSTYNYGFRDIHFIDAERGWLIGNFYGRAQSNVGGIFATTDGGATWKRLPITIQTQYSSGRFTPGMFHSIRFIDAMTGSVTGEMQDGEGRYFFALHTRDGGQTWEQFRTPSRATHSTQFLDLFHGWTAACASREGGADARVYDTTLMRTDNGGMSWRNDFIAKGRRIHNVFFLSPAKGWAVGDRGMILRYEDRSKANLGGN